MWWAGGAVLPTPSKPPESRVSKEASWTGAGFEGADTKSSSSRNGMKRCFEQEDIFAMKLVSCYDDVAMPTCEVSRHFFWQLAFSIN